MSSAIAKEKAKKKLTQLGNRFADSVMPGTGMLILHLQERQLQPAPGTPSIHRIFPSCWISSVGKKRALNYLSQLRSSGLCYSKL
ncbi:hypothetical protein [Nostoc sp.]|uniref:hypothetical protein n=1 Tax=Nostoc sp. TaxID=1180 RepID=UPI002FF5DC67